MTLGPGIALLALVDREPGRAGRVLVVFGRVPLFYYVVHLYVLRTLAAAAFSATGHTLAELDAAPSLGAPPGYGFELGVVYAVWIAVVAGLYPACRWFADVKATARRLVAQLSVRAAAIHVPRDRCRRSVVRPPLAGLALALLVAGCSGTPRPPCDPTPPKGTLGSVCGFENPEDVEAVPQAGVVLVSNMRPLSGGPGGGFLMALPVRGTTPYRVWPRQDAVLTPLLGDPSCTAPPAADAFAPHGLTSMPTDTPGVVRVALVHHLTRESIELFDLVGTAGDVRLAWRGCVPLPPDTVGNDVAFAPDGEIVAGNFQPTIRFPRGFFYMMESGVGMRTGDVMTWRPERGWRHLPGTGAAAPNGMAVSADGASIFYAETGKRRVVRVPRAGLAPGEAPRLVDVGGRPDNLAWSPRGTLIAGVHTSDAALLCMFGRRPCRSSWKLTEIDPATLAAHDVLGDDGSVVGAVASATEIDGCTYFGSVFDDRIGVVCR